MHLDTGLNMVIVEFCDSSGHVTLSLPTAQALAKFRLNMNDSQLRPLPVISGGHQMTAESTIAAHGLVDHAPPSNEPIDQAARRVAEPIVSIVQQSAPTKAASASDVLA